MNGIYIFWDTVYVDIFLIVWMAVYGYYMSREAVFERFRHGIQGEIV
jgi:hypothetical protein